MGKDRIVALAALVAAAMILGCQESHFTPINFPNYQVFRYPSFSSAGDKIVFLWFPSEAREPYNIDELNYDGIYVMNADGTGKRRIQFSLSQVIRRPRFSPSGEWIAFSDDGIITKISVTGDEGKQLYAYPSRDPFWSPDEQSLVFAVYSGAPSSQKFHLGICDTSGHDSRIPLMGGNPIICASPIWMHRQQSIMFLDPFQQLLLTFEPGLSQIDTVMSAVQFQSFDLAGDDVTIVYELAGHIWAQRTGELDRVSVSPRRGYDPSISDDGQRVLFVSDDDETNCNAIWVAAVDGSWATRLVSARDSL